MGQWVPAAVFLFLVVYGTKDVIEIYCVWMCWFMCHSSVGRIFFFKLFVCYIAGISCPYSFPLSLKLVIIYCTTYIFLKDTKQALRWLTVFLDMLLSRSAFAFRLVSLFSLLSYGAVPFCCAGEPFWARFSLLFFGVRPGWFRLVFLELVQRFRLGLVLFW